MTCADTPCEAGDSHRRGQCGQTHVMPGVVTDGQNLDLRINDPRSPPRAADEPRIQMRRNLGSERGVRRQRVRSLCLPGAAVAAFALFRQVDSLQAASVSRVGARVALVPGLPPQKRRSASPNGSSSLRPASSNRVIDERNFMSSGDPKMATQRSDFVVASTAAVASLAVAARAAEWAR